MNANPIPSYSAGEFRELLLDSDQVLDKHPCLVRGFVKQWPAAQSWTSFEYLTQRFGEIPVTAGAPQFVTHKDSIHCQVMTTFSKYLQYLETPERIDTLFNDEWIKGDLQTFKKLGLPLYCGNMQFVRHSKDTVFNELQPIVPEPLESWNSEIPYFYQSGNHLWLYVSNTGALTPLHQDNNAVIAYLAQLAGHKSAILYPPQHHKHYFNPDVGYMDPLTPSKDDFPTWQKAQPWIGDLHPGDLLIWGQRWAHHVITHARSVTVSFDFVNANNLAAYANSTDWRRELGRFAFKHATLIKERVNDTQVLDALAGDSKEQLGKELMKCVLSEALKAPQPSQSKCVKQQLYSALN